MLARQGELHLFWKLLYASDIVELLSRVGFPVGSREQPLLVFRVLRSRGQDVII